MKKKYILLSFVLILCGIFSIIGFAANDNLDIIKVGLQYPKENNSTSLKPVVIQGQTGFELGQVKDQVYSKHITLEDLKTFSLKEDTFYHGVIGPLASVEEAKAIMETHVEEGFLVKGQELYVYSKGVADESQAQTFVNTYTGQGYQAFLARPNKALILAVDGRAKVGFLSNEGDFLLAPLNGGLENQTFVFGGVNYRGGIGAKNQYLNDLSLINYVRMHEYLYGVVPREMSKSWPIEALKAQAVVARNYANVNQNKFMDYGFNLDNTVASQVYGGFDWEGPVSNQAVDETKGISLYHGDTLVSGFYHSNSGGFTENSENVWSTPLPYIKGVADPFSKEDTFALTYTATMIEKKLKSAGHDLGSLLNFEITDYTANNRVLNAQFVGSKTTVNLPKETIRKVFGHNEIRSTLLTVEPDNTVVLTDGQGFVNKAPQQVHVLSASRSPQSLTGALVVSDGKTSATIDGQSTSYRVTGSGWGHGLGLSQWGAKTMAELDYSFQDILVFYYQGTHIE